MPPSVRRNLFCGFLIVANNIKPWYIWAYYVNPAQWIIYGERLQLPPCSAAPTGAKSGRCT